MSCARPVASPPLLVTPGDVTRDHLQTLTTPIHPIYKRQMAQSISKIRKVIYLSIFLQTTAKSPLWSESINHPECGEARLTGSGAS